MASDVHKDLQVRRRFGLELRLCIHFYLSYHTTHALRQL